MTNCNSLHSNQKLGRGNTCCSLKLEDDSVERAHRMYTAETTSSGLPVANKGQEWGRTKKVVYNIMIHEGHGKAILKTFNGVGSLILF